MAKSISSSTASYCSAAKFVQRYDTRSLAQRLSDTGQDVSSVLTDANLASILKEASGKVEMAALIGERYTVADLEAIAASSTNAAESLAGLVADLAIPIIFKRRPELMPSFPQVEEAKNLLGALAEGVRIFQFAETIAAGYLDTDIETPAIVRDRNLWTYQARRFFGTRGNRIPREA